MREFRRNIRSAWARVSAADIRAGMPAYRNYHATIRALADHHETEFERAALAFVIMSPRNSLMGNLRGLATCLHCHRAEIECDRFSVSGFAKWKERAMAALSGEVTLRHVKGQKIRAFHDNILHHDKSERVCVDGHMTCIASGRDMTMFDALMWARSLGYAAVLRMIEREIKILARSEGLPPSAVQAILWSARKREKAIRADEWPGNRPLEPREIPLFEIQQRASA